MVRVLYIMSTERSGSTVLDSVLGNHEAMWTMGELSDVPLIGWVLGDYCACGVPGNHCPFWTAVWEQWSRRTGGKDLVKDYFSLQMQFQRNRFLPRLLKETMMASERFQTYCAWTRVLFEVIAEQSGKPILIDSSKSPLRALALSVMPGVDLRVIHLVRDARGVAWSRKKELTKEEETPRANPTLPQSVQRTTYYWLWVNLLAAWVRSRLAPQCSVRVRYEDFVNFPATVLSEIGALVDVDCAPLGQLCETGAELKVGHIVSGNRLRMAGRVRLRPDIEWQQKMDNNERQQVWRLAGWLLRRYGYSEHPGA